MGPSTTLRWMVGITEGIEEVLRQRKIKSEAWIVDAFYHEQLEAEDDLRRLMLQGRLKAVTMSSRTSRNCPTRSSDSTAQADSTREGSI